MAASPKLQEPSMDEILASIRRIIADDELTSAPRRGSGEGSAAPSRRYEEDEVPGADTRRWEPRAERRPAGSRRDEGRAADTRFQEARAQEMGGSELRPQEIRSHEAHGREAHGREALDHELHPQELDAHEMNGRELHARDLRGRSQPVADFDGLDALQELDAHLADLRASEERATGRREGRLPRSAPPRAAEAPERRRLSPEAAEGRRPAPDAAQRSEERFEERREPRAFPRDGDAERAPRRGADRREVRENLARAAGPAPQRPSLAAVRPGSEPEPSAPGGRRRDLLSPAADAAVVSAMSALGDLVLPQRDRTVEDLVKEILRPMLKDWLDENLPDLVERLVRAEIERVVRSGR